MRTEKSIEVLLQVIFVLSIFVFLRCLPRVSSHHVLLYIPTCFSVMPIRLAYKISLLDSTFFFEYDEREKVRKVAIFYFFLSERNLRVFNYILKEERQLCHGANALEGRSSGHAMCICWASYSTSRSCCSLVVPWKRCEKIRLLNRLAIIYTGSLCVLAISSHFSFESVSCDQVLH